MAKKKKVTYVALKPAKKLTNSKKKKTIVTHVAPQKKTGSKKKYDSKIQALPPGRRISSKGNVYYERRENRSDKTKNKV